MRCKISIDTSKEEEQEEEGESSHQPMEIKNRFTTEELPLHIEDIHQELSTHLQERPPSHEGPSSQEGPPA